MPATRIWLIRHGQAAGNAEFRYLGRTDAPLTPIGIEQARHLAKAFSEVRIDAVYTSPLHRAVQTASLCGDAHQLAPQIHDDLRELDFGDWENATRSDVCAADADILRAWENGEIDAPPSGESNSSLSQRTVAAFQQIAARHRRQSVMVVSHVGPIKAIVCDVLGLSIQGSRRMWLDPASVTLIEIQQNNRILLRMFNSKGPR